MIDYGFVSQTFCKHLFRTQLAPSAPSSETSGGGSVKRGPHRAGEKIPDQKLSKTEFFFLSSSSLIVEMAPLRGRDTSRRTGLRGEIGMSFCGKNRKGRGYPLVREHSNSNLYNHYYHYYYYYYYYCLLLTFFGTPCTPSFCCTVLHYYFEVLGRGSKPNKLRLYEIW